MRFGVDIRREKTGADLAILVFQIASILPVAYVLIAPNYPPLLAQKGVFSALFDLGCSVISRAEAFALSALYRAPASEMRFTMLLLAIALAFGAVMKRLLHGEVSRARKTRIVYAAWLALDLLLRLIPVHGSVAFGLPLAIAAFVIRAICLALVLLDLRAFKKKTEMEESA